MLACSLASCAGVQDDGLDPTEPAAPYTLKADKEYVESDGKDVVTLTIEDANGLVLTSEEHIRNTSFNIVGTSQWQSGFGSGVESPNEYSFIVDGEYTIQAMYNGKMCENKVTVVSRNRKKYERFHKNVAVYRLTATWCEFCPSMTEALGNVDDYTRAHTVVMQFHKNDEFSLYPTGSAFDCASVLLSRFGTADDGLPYCIYSLTEGSRDRRVTDIQNYVRECLFADAASTGIKAVSSVDGNSLTVNVSVMASEAGEYDLGWAFIQDGCIPAPNPQEPAYEDEYNDVVRAISGNFHMMSSDAFTLAADQEKSMELNLTDDIVSAAGENAEVAVFTLVRNNGKVAIDNIVKFKAGESVEYKYN